MCVCVCFVVYNCSVINNTNNINSMATVSSEQLLLATQSLNGSSSQKEKSTQLTTIGSKSLSMITTVSANNCTTPTSSLSLLSSSSLSSSSSSSCTTPFLYKNDQKPEGIRSDYGQFVNTTINENSNDLDNVNSHNNENNDNDVQNMVNDRCFNSTHSPATLWNSNKRNSCNTMYHNNNGCITGPVIPSLLAKTSGKKKKKESVLTTISKSVDQQTAYEQQSKSIVFNNMINDAAIDGDRTGNEVRDLSLIHI